MAKIKSFGVRAFIGSAEIGGLKTVDLPEVEVTDVDLTTHGSAGSYREYQGGLKDGGAVTIGGAYDIEDAGQGFMRTPANVGGTYAMAVVFSDGSNATFQAVLKGYGVTNPLDENVEFSASFKMTGAVRFFVDPPFAIITGITSPAGIDPLVLSRAEDIGGKPHYADENFSLDYDAGVWVLQGSIGANAYTATVESISDDPFDIGDAEWEVSAGAGAPTITPAYTPPA
jgi:predicted secreted protein